MLTNPGRPDGGLESELRLECGTRHLRRQQLPPKRARPRAQHLLPARDPEDRPGGARSADSACQQKAASSPSPARTPPAEGRGCRVGNYETRVARIVRRRQALPGVAIGFPVELDDSGDADWATELPGSAGSRSAFESVSSHVYASQNLTVQSAARGVVRERHSIVEGAWG